MRKLTPQDVPDLDQYLAQREEVRVRARAARAAHRVAVGERISLTFENRQTVLFQILEMMRVENLRDPVKIAEEVATYNDLIGGDNELRATFFVEITDRARIKDDLDSLIGLEAEGLFLLVDGQRVPAEFEPGHAREDRISAVHFVGFHLSPEQARAIVGHRAQLGVEIDHPAYQATATIDGSTAQALANDLSGDLAPLLPQ